MTDILRLVAEADRRTLPTLSQLSENGLGTFTFSQQKLDIGNKFTVIQRPIFLLAGKLVQSLGLKQVRPLAAVVQLNYTAVAQETPFSRDVVEGCIRETLLVLFRALASEQNVFLTLQGIGVLSFKNNKSNLNSNSKVRMKFNRDFIHAMDGTGRLLLAFNNRPGSSVSLLSGGLSRLHRPLSANPVTLPTVCSPQPDNKAADKDLCSLSPTPDQRNAGDSTVSTRRPTTSIFPPDVAPKLEEPRVSVSCSGHTRAGQELCYLCMQRGQRNVPVYLREQQQAEEKAQEKLLLLKEQQRDKQYMDEEQAKMSEHREQAKQMAAFNLQMSEKKDKTYCPLFPTSFIFPARPLTPVRRIQQHRYMNELQSQIESRRQHEAQDQQNRLLMEHLDQVQLVQEIALQKAQQLQQKHERTKHYKKALDTQARTNFT
ncbi:Coiled-coil domain-containing protein 81 [Nibea albiflora]|uniref:Coiled-coil domain-containing protein 81 n=1 Tax=Nibea albiflora TaxID=240163 RepID=A0ACB7EI45_NIBAL|nr:Coiled-coil domain-containing protein 81 [Nibea albiflora]